VLLIATPSNSLAHVLTFIALIALLLMHALYWMLTHAVNKFWVADRARPVPPFSIHRANGQEEIGHACAIAGSIPTSPAPAAR
jgi:hypothetical protein